MLPTKGEADKMKSQGPDTSGMKHQNNPQRAAWEDGHSVNESYKVPGAHQGGRTMNHSYMHPLVNPAKAWAPGKDGTDGDPGVSGSESPLKTKAPAGKSGKVVFSPQVGKSKA